MLLGLSALRYLAAQGPIPAQEQQHAEQEDARSEGGPQQHCPRVDARLYGQCQPLSLQLVQLILLDGEQHLGQDLLQHGILLLGRHGDRNCELMTREDDLVAIAVALLQ
ncbi:hypothetical protein D3C79_658940 [compost metagenome]